MEKSDRSVLGVARNWNQKVHLRVADLDLDGLISIYNFTELGCVFKYVDDFQLAWDFIQVAVLKQVRILWFSL